MIKLDTIFCDFLKISIVGFDNFEREDLNYKVAQSLLCISSYIPSSQQEQIYWIGELIKSSFIFYERQRQKLMALISEIKPFRRSGEYLDINNIITQIFSHMGLKPDSTGEGEQYVQLVNDFEAGKRTNELITKFNEYFRDQKVLTIDMSSRIQQKQLSQEQSSIYPSIMKGLFQRQVLRDIFSDESTSQIAQFPIFDSQQLPEEEKLQELQLPSSFKTLKLKNQEKNRFKEEILKIKKISEEIPLSSSSSQQSSPHQQSSPEQLSPKSQPSPRQQPSPKQQLPQKQESSTKQQQQPKLFPSPKQEQQQHQQQPLNQQSSQNQQTLPEKQIQPQIVQTPKLTLEDCGEYYNEMQQCQKLPNFPQELTSILKAHFANVYDLFYKVAVIDAYISELSLTNPQNMVELNIIKVYMKNASENIKKDLIGCQSFPNIVVCLLLFYNRTSLFKLFIGELVYSSPLLPLNASEISEFQISDLSQQQVLRFFLLQITLLVDSPQFFIQYFKMNDYFLPKYIVYSISQQNPHYPYSLGTKLKFPMVQGDKMKHGLNVDEGIKLQNEIKNNFFELIRNSKNAKSNLIRYLFLIQKVCNVSGLLEVESIVSKDDQKSKINDEDQLELTFTQKKETKEAALKQMMAYDQKDILKKQNFFANCLDSSLVNLEKELETKIIFDEILYIKTFKELRVFRPLRSPNFTLNFIPDIQTINELSEIQKDLQQEIKIVVDLIKSQKAKKSEINEAKEQVKINIINKFKNGLGLILARIAECLIEENYELYQNMDLLFFLVLEDKVRSINIS